MAGSISARGLRYSLHDFLCIRLRAPVIPSFSYLARNVDVWERMREEEGKIKLKRGEEEQSRELLHGKEAKLMQTKMPRSYALWHGGNKR